MSQRNAKVAQRIQEKFFFYLVGLTFTVLGLSVQTAKFGVSPISDALELAAWLVLLVSGLSGLSRIARTPLLYQLSQLTSNAEKDKQELEQASLTGTPVIALETGQAMSIKKTVAGKQEALELGEQRISKRQRLLQVLWRIQRTTFSAGIILLVGARAYTPLIQLFNG